MRTPDAAKLAAEAHSNLNLFAVIISILEGGHVYGPDAGTAAGTAKKIIKLCKAETHKQLVTYDKNITSLKVKQS